MLRAFGDSAPDRWGRNFIEEAQRTRAREKGTASRRLDDVDFLLGDDFWGKPSNVQRLISLPKLLHACDELATGWRGPAAWLVVVLFRSAARPY